MKCPSCQAELKDEAKFCKKCGFDFETEPLWQPTWKWHLRVLGIICVVLIVAYFAITKFLSRLPPPYQLREIPKEITPWIKP